MQGFGTIRLGNHYLKLATEARMKIKEKGVIAAHFGSLLPYRERKQPKVCFFYIRLHRRYQCDGSMAVHRKATTAFCCSTGPAAAVM
jgi:hypothetical protein